MTRRDWWRGGAALGALVLVAQLVDFGYGADHGIYATVADTMQRGGAPYRDAWDFKPPGIFVLYVAAGWLFGFGVHAIRLLEAIGVCSLPPACGWLTRIYLHDERPGVLGGVLAILGYVQLEFWHTGQPESFGAVVILWAVVVAASAMAAPRVPMAWWAATGALYGIATLLKPTIGFAGVGSLGVGLALARTARVRLLLAFSVGCLGVVAGGLSVLAWVGAWPAFLDAMTFAASHTRRGWATFGPGQVVVQLLAGWLFLYSAVNLCGLLLLTLLPMDRVRWRGGAHLASVIALLLVGIAMQAKFFAYHFGSVLPLTAFLAGVGYWALSTRLGRYGPVAIGALLLALLATRTVTPQLPEGFLARSRLRLVAWTHPDRRAAVQDQLYSVAGYRSGPVRETATWLRTHTPPMAPIFVWGFTATLYTASGHPSASRYIYNVALRTDWAGRDASRAVLMRELTQQRPAAIIVEHGDATTKVTGRRTDSATDLAEFDALRAFLADYRRVLVTPQYDGYLQRTASE